MNVGLRGKKMTFPKIHFWIFFTWVFKVFKRIDDERRKYDSFNIVFLNSINVV